MPNNPLPRPSPAAGDAAARPTTSRRFLLGRVIGAAAGLAVAAGLSIGPGASPTAAQDASATGGAIGLEKATNGVDADVAPGPAVEPGSTVSWTWTVTATGAVSLFDVVVTDSSGEVPSCDVTGDGQPDGTNIHPGPIDPGQTFTCVASGFVGPDAGPGTFAATGSVRASDFAAAARYEASDPSHHHVAEPFVADPGVSIQTLVDGQIAAGTDAPLVTENEAITWSYVVTNTGNVPLRGIRVSDDGGLSIDCGDGTPVVSRQLTPGASATCRADTRATDQGAGPQSQTGSVVAAAVDPASGAELGQVQASDLATYVPVQLPGQLAFTGPTDLVIPLGFALTVLGGVLMVVTARTGGAAAPTVIETGRSQHPPLA